MQNRRVMDTGQTLTTLRADTDDPAFPRHVPYSVKSFGPPSPSAVKTGFDFGVKGKSVFSRRLF